MRLAAKLVSIFVLVVIAVLLIDGFLSIQREVDLLEENATKDAELLGEALKGVIADAWRIAGQDRTLQLISDANRGQEKVRIRWIWLDVPPDDPFRPRIDPEKLSEVVAGNELSLSDRDADGGDCLYHYEPVPVSTARKGALELAEPLLPVEQSSRNTMVRIALLTGILVILSSFLTWILGLSFVGRPLKILTERAKRVGTGDLTTSIQIKGQDELAELERAMNEMCKQLEDALKQIRAESEARIAALEQLRHADRLKTVGRLASGIAHELGTPLNVVSGRAGMIVAGKLEGEEIVESASIIKEQVSRIASLIRQLLDFARRNPPRKEVVDLYKVVQETADLLAPQIQKRKAELSLLGEEDLHRTLADARQVQQVLMNLIMNATEAMPQGGGVEIGVRRVRARSPDHPENEEGEYICIDVKDNGEGIARENLPHIFEPFFTTKDVGEGTGLGLSITYGIIQEHGGWIDVASERGKGSCFSIYLPVESESCAETF